MLPSLRKPLVAVRASCEINNSLYHAAYSFLLLVGLQLFGQLTESVTE